MQRWHALPAADCLRSLDTSDGLSAVEAARQLARDGPSILTRARHIGVARRFAGQFRSPLIYLLLAAAAVAVVMADWVDAAFIMGAARAEATKFVVGRASATHSYR